MTSLEERVQAVRELHQPELRWTSADTPVESFEFKSDAEEFSDGAEVYSFKVCKHCSDIDDARVYTPDLTHSESMWPCITMDLLGEEERVISGRFELSGTYMVDAESLDEATTLAGDALLDLEELAPGVHVEIHAISWDREYEVY